MLTLLDNIDSEKGTCGRYNGATTCEHRLVSWLVTIFTRRKAPVAAMTRKTKQ